MKTLKRTVVCFLAIPALFFLPGFAAEAVEDSLPVFIDDEEHRFEPPPFIQEGRTMVPMRGFFEAIGAEVEWHHEERTARAVMDEMDVLIPAGCTEPSVNDDTVPIDVPAEITEGRLFVPARFVAECFGYQVNWDHDQRAVLMSLQGEAENTGEGNEAAEEPEPAQDESKLENGTVEDGSEKENNPSDEEEQADKESENEENPGGAQFTWPVDGGQVVSEFGMRGGRLHYGLDIGAEEGTAILAAASGEVIYEGWESDGYGFSVVIKHGEYYTRYAHNSENLVATGDYVEQGQVIASIGLTGNASCPHVHFEIRTGGRFGDTYDPQDFISR